MTLLECVIGYAGFALLMLALVVTGTFPRTRWNASGSYNGLGRVQMAPAAYYAETGQSMRGVHAQERVECFLRWLAFLSVVGLLVLNTRWFFRQSEFIGHAAEIVVAGRHGFDRDTYLHDEAARTYRNTAYKGDVPTIVTGAGAADVIALCTFPPDITTAVKGIRDAGVATPIFSPWSGDGTFWIPPDLTDFTFSTFASVFGDDPNADVNALIKSMTDAGSPPATGGFVTGAATIEAIAAAIEKAGSTDGAALAAEFEKFSGLETTSGKITFSPTVHTVFGREYRIMTFTNGKPTFQKLMAASSPADIS